MPRSRSRRTITGVCSLSARSNASTAKSKHSLGSEGISITCFVSPCEAYAEHSMSDCWVLVGIPVEGPPL